MNRFLHELYIRLNPGIQLTLTGFMAFLAYNFCIVDLKSPWAGSHPFFIWVIGLCIILLVYIFFSNFLHAVHKLWRHYD